MRRRLALVSIVLASLACAQGPKQVEDVCATEDWRSVGHRDGTTGFRITRFIAHQDACVLQAIVPDEAAYLLGWREGIEEFCDTDNAFQLGWSGRAHNNVCPDDLKQAFVAAYREGRKLFLAEAQVVDLESRLKAKRVRLLSVKERIALTRARELKFSGTPAKRIALAARLQRLEDEQRVLEMEKIPWLENELARRTSELEDVSNAVAALGF